VNDKRLAYPPEVLDELERNIDPKMPDEQYQWTKANATTAHTRATYDLADVKAVLAEVPAILDSDKDSGVEEADTREQGHGVENVHEYRRWHLGHSLCSFESILGSGSIPIA
jgi:hypothetical protein